MIDGFKVCMAQVIRQAMIINQINQINTNLACLVQTTQDQDKPRLGFKCCLNCSLKVSSSTLRSVLRYINAAYTTSCTVIVT